MVVRRVTYCGIEGEGPTAKAAREQAERRLELAMTGSYNPWVFRDCQHTLFVWREPTGWTYRIVWPDFPNGQHLQPNIVPVDDFQCVSSKAAYHFAQSVYTGIKSIPIELTQKLSLKDRHELQMYYELSARALQNEQVDQARAYELDVSPGHSTG